jgi:hypothetical protein
LKILVMLESDLFLGLNFNLLKIILQQIFLL